MKIDTNKLVAVKINNQSEKLAALYHLSAVTGFPIRPKVLQETLEGISVTHYPYVYIRGDEVTANTGRFDSITEPKTILEFTDLNKFAEVAFIAESYKVKLNSEYSAIVEKDTVKVGCQTFPYSAILEIVAAHDKLI